MPVNKFIFGGETKFDLTGDTIDKEHLSKGYTAHDKTGALITGENTNDSDTSDDTAAVAEILYGKTAHARGTLLEGTMPNNGGVSGEITTKNGQYVIPQGFHDGSGKVSISSSEKAKIIAGNIKSGVEILGITGEYTGESITAQSKTVTPTILGFDVAPDTGYDYLSGVHVNAIPYTETPNSAGGTTITIG